MDEELYAALRALTDAADSHDYGNLAAAIDTAREVLGKYEAEQRVAKAIENGIYGDFTGRLYE